MVICAVLTFGAGQVSWVYKLCTMNEKALRAILRK